MKSLRTLWAILLLAGIFVFSSCTRNESKKEFTQEKLQLTSWKGNIEINSIGQKMEIGIRFNADDTCLLRWIEQDKNTSATARFKTEKNRRLTFFGCNPDLTFHEGPWVVTEWTGNTLVMKYAMESPDEKDHETMTLRRVE